jgi:C1A family cysteine protease
MMGTKRILKFGWLPDVPDFKDFDISLLKLPTKKLPEAVDLRKECSPVEDQGNLGSCTANAAAGAVEFLEIKAAGNDFIDASRLFIYRNSRALINTIDYDSGAYLRDTVKTLAKEGVCSEASWPYDISKFTQQPPDACYAEALDHQILSYYRMNKVKEMKACLAGGIPFVFGFSVYSSFMTDTVAKTGKAKMPKFWERCLGGHAVMAVGYDDKQERFIVRNSWGAGWGLKGYFTMPYAYLESRNLSDDFWAITKQEQGGAK